MLFRNRYADTTDKELVESVAGGNERAFEELMRRHEQAVHSFARHFLRDESESGDITQETFLRLYRSARAYRQEGSLRAWLIRIARNLCIDHQRRKRPIPMQTPPEAVNYDTPPDQVGRSEELKTLEAAMDALPETQRTALALRHGSGLKYAEIAQVMDLSNEAVESLLARARKNLRQTCGRA